MNYHIVFTKQKENKKKCPECGIYINIRDFYGIKKINTTKCNNCNLRASKYKHRQRVIYIHRCI